MNTVLLVLLIVAGSTWIGGLPTLIVVRLATNRTLTPAQSVGLFRAIGRSYGVVAGLALVVAAACGALLAGSPSHWSSWQVIDAALTVGIVVVTVLGVIQARSITRRRQAAIDAGAADIGPPRRIAVAAGILRSLIAALTLAVVACTAVGLV